jgi:hypothetical protein
MLLRGIANLAQWVDILAVLSVTECDDPIAKTKLWEMTALYKNIRFLSHIAQYTSIQIVYNY